MTELEDLTVDALKDLGRVQKVEGHNDMTRDELLEALKGPVDYSIAKMARPPAQGALRGRGRARHRGVQGHAEMRADQGAGRSLMRHFRHCID